MLSSTVVLAKGKKNSNRNLFKFLPKTFKVGFVQQFKSELKGKIRKSKGFLEYKYPSKIIFEITSPEEDRIKLIGKSKIAWLITPPFDPKVDLPEVKIIDQKKNQLSLGKLFDILKYGLKSNKYYSVKSSKNVSVVTFTKKIKKEIGIIDLKLYFKKGRRSKKILRKMAYIDRMVIQDLKKKLITFKFNSFNDKLKLPDTKFNFKITKKVKVIP